MNSSNLTGVIGVSAISASGGCSAWTTMSANTITTDKFEDFKIEIRNELNGKKEKEMIESLSILQLYRKNHELDILKRFANNKKELYENYDKIKEFKELTNSYHASVAQLYDAQSKVKEGYNNSKENYIIKDDNGTDAYTINPRFELEEEQNLCDLRDKELGALNFLYEEVKAALSICKEKDDIETVLIRYGIYDKKTYKINLIRE